MITSQFNFVTGTGGRQRLLAPLLAVTPFASREVVILTSEPELAQQNKTIFPNAFCTTARQALHWENWPAPSNIVLILDSLSINLFEKFMATIDTSKMEVWTVNIRGVTVS